MNKHAMDVVSLVAGAVFLAIAGIWLLFTTVDISLPSFGWLAAGALVIVGVLGIAGALRPTPSKR